MNKLTESESLYKNLEKMKVHDILQHINHEDKKVAKIVNKAIPTSVMIKLGHVLDNKMIDMHINNAKLEERAINIIMKQCLIEKSKAKNLLKTHGTVRSVINHYNDTK